TTLPPTPTLFPYTTLFRSPAKLLGILPWPAAEIRKGIGDILVVLRQMRMHHHALVAGQQRGFAHQVAADGEGRARREADAEHRRSEEHTSELQSRENLVCR